MKYYPRIEVFSKNRSILQKSIPAVFSNLYCLALLCIKAIGTPLSKGMEWVPAWLHPPALPPEDCSRTRRQRGIAHIELLNGTAGDGGQGAELCQPSIKPERPAAPSPGAAGRGDAALPCRCPSKPGLLSMTASGTFPLPCPLERAKGTWLAEPPLPRSRGARDGCGGSPWYPRGCHRLTANRIRAWGGSPGGCLTSALCFCA